MNKINKRNLLKHLTVGGLVSSQLPSQWVSPAVKSVLLPVHAITTGVIIGTNLQITEETGGTVEIYTDSTFGTRIFPGEDVGSSYVMLFRTNPVLSNTQIDIQTRIDGEVVNMFSATTDGSGVAAVQVAQVGASLLSVLEGTENSSSIANLNPVSSAHAQFNFGLIEEIFAEADGGNFLTAFLYFIIALGNGDVKTS